MKSPFLFVIISVFLCTSAKSQTIVEAGSVSGTWDAAGSPYLVNGEINIPSGQMLTIESGVRIHFQGHHRFFVYGTMMALGSVTDSIYFTVDNDTVEWCGIEFSNPVSRVPRSLMEYCVIEHSYAHSPPEERYITNYDIGGGIMAESGNLTIRNCAIRNNKALIGAGIKCGNNIVIDNTSFTNNVALQKDVVFVDNGGKMSGCLIAGNRASQNLVRIQLETLFLNNTISGNHLDSSGVSIATIHGEPDLVNTIIYENNVSTIHVTGGSNPRFYNCNIEGGMNSVFAYDPDYKGNFAGIYENNIDCPPAFLDAANGNYQLGPDSPCIDAGSYLEWNSNFITDITGEPRIAENLASRVDMGAYEYQGNPVNRAPYIQDISTIYKLKSQTRKIRIPFYDADPQDTHVFDLSVDHDSVDVVIISSNQTSVSLEINSSPGWSGECTMHVTIKDNSGAAIDTCSANFRILVGNKYRGVIEFDEAFTDTVEVVGDIFIKEGGSLVVEEGSFIQFQDHYKIAVYGELQVLGSEDKRVKMDILDSIALIQDERGYHRGWGGIEMFYLNHTMPITLQYCDLLNTGYNKEFNIEQGTITLVSCSNILIDHCIFANNQCVYNGDRNAGIKMENCSGIQIRNSNFSESLTIGSYKGTYLWGYNSDFMVDSCKIHNTPIQGNASIRTNGGSITISHSEFCNIQQLALSLGTRDEDNCIIENNYFHDNFGGSIRCNDGIIIRNNTFLRTVSGGGVILCRGNSNIIGNFIAYNDNQEYNVGDFMGIAMNLEGDANVINNTIVKNLNWANGGAIHVSYASPYIANNILWDNDKEGIHWYNGAGTVTPPTIVNNVIKGGYADYNDNFQWDPYFRLNDSLDYQLTDSSKCINRALTDAAVFNTLLPLDLSGNPRYDTICHLLDLGAFEFQSPIEIADTVTRILPPQSLIDFNVYPNPVSEELHIESNSDILEYSIINMQGKIILQGTCSDRILVTVLPEGHYIVSLKSPSRIARRLFMKK